MNIEPSRPTDLDARRAAPPGQRVAALEQLATIAAAALRVPILFLAFPGSVEERVCIVAGSGEHPRWTAADEAALWRSGLVELASSGPTELRDMTRNHSLDQLRAYAQLRLGSLIGAPVRSPSGRVHGVICAAYPAPTTWNDDDREMLQQFARLAASDLELRRRAEELEANEERLRYHANHDALTGLATRSVLLDRLRVALERPPRPVTEIRAVADDVLAPPAEDLVAVFVVDVADVSSVNVRFGQQVADQVLVALARRLRRAAGRDSLVARLGGDRFGALVESLATADAADRLAERLRDAIEEPLTVGGEPVTLAARVGVSLSATTAMLAEHLMHRADVAVPRAAHAPQPATGPLDVPVALPATAPSAAPLDVVPAHMTAPQPGPDGAGDVATPVADVSVERGAQRPAARVVERAVDRPVERAVDASSASDSPAVSDEARGAPTPGASVRSAPRPLVSGPPGNRRPKGGLFRWVARSWRSMTGVVRNASQFAKLDSGEVKLRFKDVTVAPLLDSLWRETVPRTYAEGLRFRVQPCAPDVKVRADPVKVRRVLRHLLENAVKFTEPGGEVAIACDANEQAVRIRVTDTGCGIPAPWLTQVFEPYVQVDARRRPWGRRGLGLGLTISQRLAIAMGGELEVESRVGKGSALTLTLLRV